MPPPEPDTHSPLRRLRRAHAVLALRFAATLDYRERGASNRAQRLSRYARLMARAAGARPELCLSMGLAAPLHDVGMLGVPERIVRKTGPLTDDEWIEIRRHPELGGQLLPERGDPLIALARSVSLAHHERWDGAGYPAGLAGRAIPWAGRLVAVIDAFEAMTVTQRHRAPIAGPEAAREIIAESGRQFDPAMVEVFRKALRGMVKVLEALPDRLEGLHNLDFSTPGTARGAAAAPSRGGAAGAGRQRKTAQ